MKNKIFRLLTTLATVTALSSCGDDWQPGDGSQFPSGTGGVSSGTINVEVADEPVKATGRAGDGTTIDTSSFLVYITAKGSSDVVVFNKDTCRWNYGTMPEIVTLPVGDYTVHVASHDPEPVAWSAPYYEGTSDFTVVNNKVVNIGTVKCLFRSLKIAVHFDEDFLAAMDPDNSTVTVTAGAEGTSTVWTPAETRCAYFRLAEANPTVIAHFNGMLDGQNYTAGKTVTDARIGDYYIFNFSLNQGNPEPPEEFGSTTIPASGISIDVDMVREELNNQLKPGIEAGDNSEKHPNAEEWPDPVGPGTDPENPDDPPPPRPDGAGCGDLKTNPTHQH
ncbi:MAG: DUF4493 domain-containing protein, partial [Duncaniella sp.]|nr:DUF4493 domain-containing protein [Duncaniella sp.]